MPNILIALIVIPVVGGILSLVLRRGSLRTFAVAVALAVLGLAIYVVAQVFPGSVTRLFGGLPWIEGLHTRLFGIQLDPLSSLMLIVICGIGFLTVLYSIEYLSHRNKEHQGGPEEGNGESRYYFWLLLFIASMVGVALSPNLLQLFIFWELTTLCSWALIAHYQTEKALRAGFKALIMTHVGGLFFLVAIFVLFLLTRSFDFGALRLLSTGMQTFVFLLLLVAAWAKAAQVPFHTWLPDAMEAPTPISAYLHAAAMVKAGVYLIARVVAASWAVPDSVGLVMAIMALVTMFMALSLYFAQDDLKRLLAYSTIAHLGYIFLGISLGVMGSTIGFRGGILHIIAHGFGKSTLFLVAGAVAYVTGSRSISKLSGLARSMPLVAVAFFVGALTVTGVPPFAAFWSKFYLLTGALQLPGAIGPIILILVLVESLISFGWMLYVGQRMFFGEVSALANVHSDPPWPMSATLVVLMVMCLIAQFVGLPFVETLTVGSPLGP